MAEIRRRYACRVCSRSFTQSSHVRRHERTHTDEAEFKCPFCHDRFTRSDSARRHSKTCSRGHGRPLPSVSIGRKYHACDCCALSKSGCDGGHPCSSCLTRKQLCTYSRVLQRSLRNSKSGNDVAALDSDTKVYSELDLRVDDGVCLKSWAVEMKFTHGSAERKSDNVLVVFLLHYTNPRNDSIQDYFSSSSSTDKSALDPGAAIQDESNMMLSPDPNQLAGNSTDLDVLGLVWEVDFSISEQSDIFYKEPEQGAGPASQLDQLQINLVEISSALSATNTGQLSFTAYSMLVEATEFIFTPQKAPSFIKSYFQHWHPHCPMLHPSSFNLSHTFSPLSAAVILIGASFSSKKAATAARICLDAAEEYIFSHQDFLHLMDPAKASTDIAPLQAAFIIVLVQHWDNHSTSWRRIRQHRYPDIIRAARNMGLPSLRHRGCYRGLAATSESWEAFIKTEECIRLMAYIFLVDSSQAVFHQTHPLLALSELTGSFPCSEDLFAGQSAETQGRHREGESFYKIQSIADGVALLMAGSWANDTPSRFGQLSYLDLFILVSGLHELIFSSYSAHSLKRSKTALRRALARWKYLWNLNVEKMGDVENDCHGFFRNADEYWWLANMLLQEGSPLLSNAEECANGDYMDNMHGILRQFDRLSIKSA